MARAAAAKSSSSMVSLVVTPGMLQFYRSGAKRDGLWRARNQEDEESQKEEGKIKEVKLPHVPGRDDS